MITAKEALKLTRESSDYNEKLQYYTELIDTSIKEAAKDQKRSIIVTIDNYDVAQTITDELLSSEFDVWYARQKEKTLLTIGW